MILTHTKIPAGLALPVPETPAVEPRVAGDFTFLPGQPAERVARNRQLQEVLIPVQLATIRGVVALNIILLY
jgi:hypothetical protein